jgi:hypothetical protein
MKKLSTYARKMRRTDQTYNAAAWLNTLTKCRAYSDELLPGAIAKVPSFEAIRAMIIETRMSFERMKSGYGTSHNYDVLIVALGEAKIRYAQIAGNENQAVDALDTADAALLRTRIRWEKTGVWGFDGPALAEIADGLDLFEEVATNSSPMQMRNAMLERNRLVEQLKRNYTAM